MFHATFLAGGSVPGAAACGLSKLNPRGFIGGLERMAIACLYGDADKRSAAARPQRTPTRTVLLLESIVRHQIAVLERSGTRRPCFRRWDRLFWILFSRWWPQWRDSLIIVQPRRSCAGAVTVGHRLGDIDPGVAGAVGARGSPAKSAI
jgi:hypothetical protein